MSETPSIAKHKPEPKEKRQLPTINEIYNDQSLAPLARASAFQVLVNQNPDSSWIKKHPIATKEIVKIVNGKEQKEKVPVEFIPIERIEWLLSVIFLKKRVEIKTVQLIGNSVCVTVRLHYYNHIDDEWNWEDGVGATPLQTNAGSGATDFNALKSSAVQIAAPSAESYAIKDAAEKIGKLFGKDLNRRDIISYDTLIDKYSKAMGDEPKTESNGNQ